jgi:hypothetical protein
MECPIRQTVVQMSPTRTSYTRLEDTISVVRFKQGRVVEVSQSVRASEQTVSRIILLRCMIGNKGDPTGWRRIVGELSAPSARSVGERDETGVVKRGDQEAGGDANRLRHVIVLAQHPIREPIIWNVKSIVAKPASAIR